jgi:Fe-S-cluster containining protein
MIWICHKCGACCRVVNCLHLTDECLCAIYDARPDICRVKMGADQALLIKTCNDLRVREANLDKIF